MNLTHKKNYTVPGIFWEIVRVNPLKFIAQYAITIASSVLLGLFIAQLQTVFDNIAELTKAMTEEHIRAAVISFAILFAYKLCSESLEILNGYFGTEYYRRCAEHFLSLYNKKVSVIPAIEFEKENELDRIKKAQEGATAGRGMLHVLMDILTFYIPYFVTVGIYFFRQDKSLLLIFPLVILPVLVTNAIKKSFSEKYADATVKPKRRKAEFAKYLSELRYIRDNRVKCLTGFFQEKLGKERKDLNSSLISYNRKTIIVDCITKMITLMGFLGILYILINKMWIGVISIGAFGAIFFSLEDVYSMMDECLVGRIAEYNESRPFLEAFIDLMNSETSKESAEKEHEELNTLSLKNVSFTYPNAQKPALQNINLTINRNDKIAVVGYNGSGKSTLAKILAGLYVPERGELAMNGHPVDHTDPSEVSVLFQDFGKYKETVLNNVVLGDIDKVDESSDMRDVVTTLLDKVHFKNNESSSKLLGTLCAREFGGTDLSGGEWQRIATTRMLFRDRDFVILDEPTSAIDPVSEHELYSLFEKELLNKTAIIITHRLMSIKFCNKIVVMNDGNVEAVGTHDSLLKESALYRKLYNAAKNPVEN